MPLDLPFCFFGPVPTFLLMVLITATAFLLAVRLDALVVAILGMLGGFLTPILISTGQDNPLGLFGYIAILDTGLILVALNRRWYFLAALAAAGTVFLQIGWAEKFFTEKISRTTKSSWPWPCCWASTRSISPPPGGRSAAGKQTRG